ncbi:hypothetical protein CC2G_013269 [Coprinopsis cinerea AmutBmut pab1-1]|nr:hypothetical protein CC2G_013269 [Coprinopsis cinerea AmutBmut pab1-1]
MLETTSGGTSGGVWVGEKGKEARLRLEDGRGRAEGAVSSGGVSRGGGSRGGGGGEGDAREERVQEERDGNEDEEHEHERAHVHAVHSKDYGHPLLHPQLREPYPYPSPQRSPRSPGFDIPSTVPSGDNHPRSREHVFEEPRPHRTHGKGKKDGDETASTTVAARPDRPPVSHVHSSRMLHRPAVRVFVGGNESGAKGVGGEDEEEEDSDQEFDINEIEEDYTHPNYYYDGSFDSDQGEGFGRSDVAKGSAFTGRGHRHRGREDVGGGGGDGDGDGDGDGNGNVDEEEQERERGWIQRGRAGTFVAQVAIPHSADLKEIGISAGAVTESAVHGDGVGVGVWRRRSGPVYD